MPRRYRDGHTAQNEETDRADVDQPDPNQLMPGVSQLTPEQMGGGFVRLIGMTVDEAGPDRVRVSVPIGPHLLQPWGILHGGVHCSIVETAASIAGALWFGDRGDVVGVANSTNFLRASREGTLHGEATPIHRGRTQQLWLVQITDDDERLVARGEVRLANLVSTDDLARREQTR